MLQRLDEVEVQLRVNLLSGDLNQFWEHFMYYSNLNERQLTKIKLITESEDDLSCKRFSRYMAKAG